MQTKIYSFPFHDFGEKREKEKPNKDRGFEFAITNQILTGSSRIMLKIQY